ncbi:MAG TPA: helix-turn-helix transcriptional regulator [Candidatus Nanoarchaeia archaeon]|nr:helix-turn-helix transcriptional regulator [Candidatus Nanoarchaeia archaeon]
MESILRVTEKAFKPLHMRINELPEEFNTTMNGISHRTGVAAIILKKLGKRNQNTLKNNPNYATLEKLAAGLGYAPVLLYLKAPGIKFFDLQGIEALGDQAYPAIVSRGRREELMILQMDLAKTLGVSGPSLAAYENHRTNYKLNTSQCLWEELGLSPRYLVKYSYSSEELRGIITSGVAQLSNYLEIANETLSPKEIRKMTEGLLEKLEKV